MNCFHAVKDRNHLVTLIEGFSSPVVKHGHKVRATCTFINEVFINYTFTPAQWLACKMKWFNPI